MDSDLVARSAVLAMLLEVSATPKSGNVDREHSFPDIRYEHFLASSVSVYSVYKKAAERDGKIGELIKQTVKRSIESQLGGNVHFGTFILLVPLCYASADSKPSNLGSYTTKILKETDYKDSLKFVEAYKLANARLLDSEELDIRDSKSVDEIKRLKVNLFELMSKAPSRNLIAEELANEYKVSYFGMNALRSEFEKSKDINGTIVWVYHLLLSKFPDSLIIAKFGRQLAEDVMRKARDAMITRDFGKLDEELLEMGINPGTIADLTTSSIFLALIEGLRF